MRSSFLISVYLVQQKQEISDKLTFILIYDQDQLHLQVSISQEKDENDRVKEKIDFTSLELYEQKICMESRIDRTFEIFKKRLVRNDGEEYVD